MKNGGLIGKINNTSGSRATGVFSLKENYSSVKTFTWPLGIVRNGLVLYLDPGDISSYPRSGSTWFDLSGSNNHMTLTNSPTFSSANGGVFQFNGSNQYAQNSLNLSSSNMSIIAASRYSGATRGRVITSTSNNWLFGHWGSQANMYYAEGWITGTSGGPNDTNWRIFAGIENFAADQRSFYSNNTLLISNSNGGSAGMNGLSIGRWAPSNSEYSTCEVGVVLIYNRVLTTDEITQNFEAIRSRYGI